MCTLTFVLVEPIVRAGDEVLVSLFVMFVYCLCWCLFLVLGWC